jgi:hypothetical protein
MLYTNSKMDYPSQKTLPAIPCIPYSDVKSLGIEADMALALVDHDPNARPRHFRNAFEEYIVVFTVMMATASITFLQGVIIINTATIGRDWKMTPAQITWIKQPCQRLLHALFRKTAGLFGRKIQLLAGMLVLSLFSLGTSFAPNPITMNVLCGFLGLGTAMISLQLSAHCLLRILKVDA